MAQANAFMANNATPKKPMAMNTIHEVDPATGQQGKLLASTPAPTKPAPVQSVMTNDQALAAMRQQAQSPQYVGPNAASLTAKAQAQGLTPVLPAPRPATTPGTPAQGGTNPNGPFSPPFSSNPQLQQPGVPLSTAPGAGGGYADMFNTPGIMNLNPADQSEAEYMNRNLAARLPLAQLGQTGYQFTAGLNENMRQFDTQMRQQKVTDQFGMSLSTRQQQQAENMAAESIRQWNDQFGHQKANDLFNQGLSNRQLDQLTNYQGGLITNQANEITANRDVGMDANAANRYGADTRLKGEMYGADRGLDVANVYGGAQRYGADTELRGQMYGADRNVDVAGLYSGAQRYGADTELRGQMYGADRNLDVAGVYGAAQRYGSDNDLRGQMYNANQNVNVAGIYGAAQRYGSDNDLQGKRYDMQGQMYGADRSVDSANVYGSAQRYAADQDAQAARYAASMNAYGRSQAPRTGWATNWA